MTQKVSIIGVDGCTATNLMGAADIFATANLLLQHISDTREIIFDIKIVSPDGQPIRCSNSYTVSVNGSLDQIGSGDVVICLPFAMKAPNEFIGALERLHSLTDWLAKNAHSFDMVVATGSGIFLLAEAGLLAGKTTCTAWWFDQLFRERYPNINLDDDSIYLKEGNILCSGLTNSWQDTYLRVVEKYGGSRYAKIVSRYLMVDYERRIHTPLVYISQVQTSDSVVNKADIWIQKYLAEKICVKDIAEYASVSQRTLNRHFQTALGMSPLSYIQKTRLENCKLLLDISDMTFSEIVNRCGYKDETSFRRLFMKTYSVTPAEYRRSCQK